MLLKILEGVRGDALAHSWEYGLNIQKYDNNRQKNLFFMNV